jgi:hypothetical protein
LFSIWHKFSPKPFPYILGNSIEVDYWAEYRMYRKCKIPAADVLLEANQCRLFVLLKIFEKVSFLAKQRMLVSVLRETDFLPSAKFVIKILIIS